MTPLILRDLSITRTPDEGGPPVAMVSHANPLRSEPQLPEKLLTPALVVWSGWEGEESQAPYEVARDFRTWSRGAWERLGHWCDALVPMLKDRGIDLWLRPHARHILADPQSCVSFLSRRQGEPIRLLLEPSAFLTGAMLDHAEDHLTRALEALGSHPGVAAVLLTNVSRAQTEDALLLASPIHRGVLDAGMLIRRWRQHVPASLPLVLLADGFDEQQQLIAALSSGGQDTVPATLAASLKDEST